MTIANLGGRVPVPVLTTAPPALAVTSTSGFVFEGMGAVVPSVVEMVALLRIATGSAVGAAAKGVPGL
jgi:hypothetical protein